MSHQDDSCAADYLCKEIQKNANFSSKGVTPSSKVESKKDWENRRGNGCVDKELSHLGKIRIGMLCHSFGREVCEQSFVTFYFAHLEVSVMLALLTE